LILFKRAEVFLADEAKLRSNDRLASDFPLPHFVMKLNNTLRKLFH